mgnify:CR=1 FL=1
MGQGAQIYYAESIDKLVSNMAEVSPHFMTAVPRFYDSLHTRISQGLKSQSKIKQKLFQLTLELGKKNYYEEKMNSLEKFTNKLMDILVRKKVNKRFGGNLKALISGGSALNFEVGLYLTALGLPLLQGYGQTETSILCGNFYFIEPKPGSMGKPAPGVHLAVINEDGNEVAMGVEGDIAVLIEPNRPQDMFKEYKGDPKRTSDTRRGKWYITGDRAYVDEDGYFWFVSRADDVILSAG